MRPTSGTTLSLRLRALTKMPQREDGTRGRTARKVGTVMAEQLELAAIYAADGATLTAAAVALLAVLGIQPTCERRCAIETDLDAVRHCVQAAIDRHGAH